MSSHRVVADPSGASLAAEGCVGPRFLIIGAGMAGILSAVKLQEAGLTNVAIYEKASALGGTWRENTYPGVACDIPSHLYSYSFAPNPNWSHVFSPGAEIFSYFEEVARRYGVDRLIHFGAEVRLLEWRNGLWHLETNNGETDEGEFVIAATGVLHHPKYPDLDGLASFEGPVFHSARWDHSVPISHRRVGVVGTGSSAVQIVGAIVDEVAALKLFQRTPQWILPIENPPIDEEDQKRYQADPNAIEVLRKELAQTFEAHFANAVVDAASSEVKVLEELCRANLDQSVKDPALRERLRPDYRAACKRLVVSSNFYDAIQKPNADLVTEAIDHLSPTGIVTKDGALHELDVVVLATGFRVDRFLRPMDVVGRGGVLLDDVWADRPSAYLSLSVPDFPNLFMLNGPNGPVGNFSLIDVAELQFAYVEQLVAQVLAGRCREVSATHDALERFEAERVKAAQKTIWVSGCRSWYLDDRGIPAAWPWSFDHFRARMAAPKLEDYELVG
ncbi:MAG: NAD(P)/FAD-dependent oxidoreductase [Actinobacteria bacterium]|nr:NAD(P)/FAD-dependent oxidoreductase [Actinomycetota bacterium]